MDEACGLERYDGSLLLGAPSRVSGGFDFAHRLVRQWGVEVLGEYEEVDGHEGLVLLRRVQVLLD